MRVRIVVVRRAVERRVAGERREVFSSVGVDGRSDLILVRVWVVWSRRVVVVCLSSSRIVDVMSCGVVIVLLDVALSVDDQGMYHGIFADRKHQHDRAHQAQVVVGSGS